MRSRAYSSRKNWSARCTAPAWTARVSSLRSPPAQKPRSPAPQMTHQADVGRGQGLLQPPGQEPDHLPVEGVEDPGSVQDQGHQAWRPGYEDGGLGLIDHMLGFRF